MWALRTRPASWPAVALAIGVGLAGCAEEVPEAPAAPTDAASPPAASPPADPMTRAQQSLAYVAGDTAASVGVVLSAEGHVLVYNPSLVEAPDQPVSVTPAGTAPVEATVLGGDPRTGLVVVTVEPAAGLVPAVLGDSDAIGVGDEVTLLSLDPDGQVRRSPGEVTATGEVVAGTGTAMIGFTGEGELGTGGPVLSGAGEVIGLASGSTRGAGGEELGRFAIPSNAATRIAGQLVETGEVIHPYLGVSVDDAPGGGALVQQVAAASPAEAAGLRAGDVIVQVGSRTVEIAADVVAEVQGRQVGEELSIAYTRDGAEEQTTATLAAAPAG